MSYVSPDRDPRPPRRPPRGPMTVAVAVLAPAALTGGLVWYVMDGSGDTASAPPEAPTAASSSATAGAHTSLSPEPGPSGSGHAKDDRPGATPDKTPSASAPAATGPLKGKVVVIDPGHNPGNRNHTAEINRSVDIGTNQKECDTTGTATNAGYPEAEFNLDVSRRARSLLEAQGATVILTQDGSRAWGPCVDERARIGNEAHADAVVSVHADGSGTGNRGFHVILPESVHSGGADTRSIAGPSRDLGERIAGKFVRFTGNAPSNYIGGGTGLDVRGDLGGLNLSTVPKVFIECGNMRDPQDAALVMSPAWRQKAAQGIAEGIMSFLRR